jgi:hypothetical protein
MHFVEQALTYLRSRETVRLSKMSQGLDNLRYRMNYDPDPQARAQAKLTYDSIYDFAAKNAPAPVTQQQAQDNFHAVAQQQQEYYAQPETQYAPESVAHYEAPPAYQQAPPQDGSYQNQPYAPPQQ